MLFFNYVESFQLPWSFSFPLPPFCASLRPRGRVQELAGAWCVCPVVVQLPGALEHPGGDQSGFGQPGKGTGVS